MQYRVQMDLKTREERFTLLLDVEAKDRHEALKEAEIFVRKIMPDCSGCGQCPPNDHGVDFTDEVVLFELPA